jgi:hypothetical protein
MDILVERALRLRSHMKHMAFAGTKITFTILESLTPLIGKSSECSEMRTPDKTSYLFTDNEILDFIALHIDYRPFGIANEPSLLNKLRGRRRIAANFIGYVAELLKEKSTMTYQQIATKAVENSYEEIVEGLFKNLVAQAANQGNCITHYYLTLYRSARSYRTDNFMQRVNEALSAYVKR